jgi:hypothetical protein
VPGAGSTCSRHRVGNFNSLKIKSVDSVAGEVREEQDMDFSSTEAQQSAVDLNTAALTNPVKI